MSRLDCKYYDLKDGSCKKEKDVYHCYFRSGLDCKDFEVNDDTTN